MTADEIIVHLGLQKHPEGGWYKETWRADNVGRPTGTAITFLLKQGEKSHWHRVDAVEIWHFYAGAPLELRLSETTAGPASTQVLGPDLTRQSPQNIVPKDCWQAARSLGDWTLVGCTVSPGFEFAVFELAAEGFDIPSV
jgi:predicted cupin superfamily sugar epimerase